MSEGLTGWVKFWNSRKYHYIRNHVSLCGKFMYLGNDPNAYDPDTSIKSDECAACRRKLNKELIP